MKKIIIVCLTLSMFFTMQTFCARASKPQANGYINRARSHLVPRPPSGGAITAKGTHKKGPEDSGVDNKTRSALLVAVKGDTPPTLGLVLPNGANPNQIISKEGSATLIVISGETSHS